MRETLTFYLGEVGALIVQFLITLAVVVVLVVIVYALVRRYSRGGLGGIGRGRVPRLAIVDVIEIDGRRKLVLLRRDNVEHLVMIGGPSDLVVEASIHRVRQRMPARGHQQAGAAPQPQQPAGQHPVPQPPKPPSPQPPPPPRPSEPPPTEPPPPAAERPRPPEPRAAAQHPPAGPLPWIHQPPVEEPEPPPREAVRARTVPNAEEAFRPPDARVQEPTRPLANRPSEPAGARFGEVQQAAYADTVTIPERASADAVEEQERLLARSEAEATGPHEAAPEVREMPEPGDDIGDRQQPLDFGDEAAPATAVNGIGDEDNAPIEERPADAAAEQRTAARVNDLEREMARLLGEITSKRGA